MPAKARALSLHDRSANDYTSPFAAMPKIPASDQSRNQADFIKARDDAAKKNACFENNGGAAMTIQTVAVITGGSSGIGAATARLFAARAHAVAILGANRERGEKMAQALSAGGVPWTD